MCCYNSLQCFGTESGIEVKEIRRPVKFVHILKNYNFTDPDLHTRVETGAKTKLEAHCCLE